MGAFSNLAIVKRWLPAGILGILCAGTGFGVFSTWRLSHSQCELGAVMHEFAPRLLEMLKPCRSNAFVRYLHGKPLVEASAELLRDGAREFLSRYSGLHVSEPEKAAFVSLASLEPKAESLGVNGLVRILEEFAGAPWRADSCPAAIQQRGPATVNRPLDPGRLRARFKEFHDRATRILAESGERAARVEADWRLDREILCSPLRSIGNVNAALSKLQERCVGKKGKALRACETTSSSLRAELDDLERIRALNAQKFIRKWNEELFERVRCERS